MARAELRVTLRLNQRCVGIDRTPLGHPSEAKPIFGTEVVVSFIAVFSAMSSEPYFFGTNGNITPADFSCSCHWFINVLDCSA